MPVSLSVKHDIDRAKRRLTDIERRQIPFATALAITMTVLDMQKELTREIPRVFDRPTNKTLTSVRAVTADKRDWPNIGGRVAIKDSFFTGVPVEKWLLAQIKGGRRKHTRFERSLIASGHMPAGKFAVPARNLKPPLKLNRFGNISKGLHTKILSALRSGIDPTQYRAQGSGTRFFSLPKGRGRLPAGIYQRRGKKSLISLVFAFVSPPRYRKRFKFHRIADSVARARMRINTKRAWQRALRTARR